jgi:hypothetical protein
MRTPCSTRVRRMTLAAPACDRVAHQVPDRLGQAVGVAGEFRHAGVVVALQAHRPAAFVLGQAQHALQHGVDVQRRVRTLRCRRQQLFHQPLRRSISDSISSISSRSSSLSSAMGGAPRQQLRRALQAGQRIAQFVRQALQRGAQRIGQDLGGIQRGELVDRMRFQQPAARAAPHWSITRSPTPMSPARSRPPRRG